MTDNEVRLTERIAFVIEVSVTACGLVMLITAQSTFWRVCGDVIAVVFGGTAVVGLRRLIIGTDRFEGGDDERG